MKTYRVKSLKWEAYGYKHGLSADSIFGLIRVLAEDNNNLSLGFFWKLETESKCFPTQEEAKAAAEAWYLDRLLPALEEVDA